VAERRAATAVSPGGLVMQLTRNIKGAHKRATALRPLACRLPTRARRPPPATRQLTRVSYRNQMIDTSIRLR